MEMHTDTQKRCKLLVLFLGPDRSNGVTINCCTCLCIVIMMKMAESILIQIIHVIENITIQLAYPQGFSVFKAREREEEEKGESVHRWNFS